jgi:hypothetical protein
MKLYYTYADTETGAIDNIIYIRFICVEAKKQIAVSYFLSRSWVWTIYNDLVGVIVSSEEEAIHECEKRLAAIGWTKISDKLKLML